MSKRLLVIATGVLMLGLMAGPAWALPTATTQVTITDAAAQGGCTSGNQAWRVSADITITNASDADTDVITSVAYSGKYTSPSGSNLPTTDVTVVDNGGLAPGVSIAPGDSRTFHVIVDLTVACDAADASLFVSYDLENGHKTFGGGERFLSGGTPVPVGAIGGIALAGLLGVGFWFVQRRKRAETAQRP